MTMIPTVNEFESALPLAGGGLVPLWSSNRYSVLPSSFVISNLCCPATSDSDNSLIVSSTSHCPESPSFSSKAPEEYLLSTSDPETGTLVPLIVQTPTVGFGFAENAIRIVFFC